MKKLAVLILLCLFPVKGLASEQLSSLPIFLYEEKMKEEDLSLASSSTPSTLNLLINLK